MEIFFQSERKNNFSQGLWEFTFTRNALLEDAESRFWEGTAVKWNVRNWDLHEGASGKGTNSYKIKILFLFYTLNKFYLLFYIFISMHNNTY